MAEHRRAAGKPLSWTMLRRALRQNRKRLLALPNVDHLGLGTKRRRKKWTGIPSIVVYVKRKGKVADEHRIPKRVKFTEPSGKARSVATDVVAIEGPPKLFGMRSGDRLLAFDGDQGISAVTFHKQARKLAITNAHVVLALEHGGQSGPVVWVDADDHELGRGTVRTVTSFDAPLIKADAALIELDPTVPTDDWQVLGTNAKITVIGRIKLDDTLQYFYVAGDEVVKCEAPIGVPDGEAVSVTADGLQFQYTDFWKLHVTDGASRPGHSGALILRVTDNGYVAAGLAFGGVEPSEIWAFSATKIWSVLGV